MYNEDIALHIHTVTYFRPVSGMIIMAVNEPHILCNQQLSRLGLPSMRPSDSRIVALIRFNKRNIIRLGGYAVAQLVEALRYKPEGRGLDSRLCHWDFSL